jgi:hypothetical protein
MSMSVVPSPSVLRPRDLALLLLASGDLRPRKRARDQQADRAGLEIKRRILEQVVATDPEPEALEAVLIKMVDEMGPPSGPIRSVAAVVRDEWQVACSTPEWVSQLLSEAVNNSTDRPKTATGGNKENRE